MEPIPVPVVMRAGHLQDVPPDAGARVKDQDLQRRLEHSTVNLKFGDGRSLEIKPQWKESYRDEYTNEVLPHHHIRAAMLDELAYLCDEVLEGVEMADAMRDPERVVVGGRWVNCNKQDNDDPKCRGRYVAQEVNVNGDADAAFYAATPHWRPSGRSSAGGRPSASVVAIP